MDRRHNVNGDDENGRISFLMQNNIKNVSIWLTVFIVIKQTMTTDDYLLW